MIREHLEKTQHFEDRGQHRPVLEKNGIKLSIQHGNVFFAESKDGAPISVQIVEHGTEPNTEFENAFKKYYSKGLGYLNVPINELETFLKDEAEKGNDNPETGTDPDAQTSGGEEEPLPDTVSGDGA